MKKLFIRILSIIITVSLVLVSTALPVFAKGMPVEIKSEAAILIDVNTGRVLAAQQEHKRVYPASVTKIMSLLLVAEAIDAGRIQFDTEVTASHDACAKGGSQIWVSIHTVLYLVTHLCFRSSRDMIAISYAEVRCR